MARNESADHRVASALLSLAEEEGKIPAYIDALKGVADDFKAEPDFPAVLSSYQIPIVSLQNIVEKVYGDIPLKHLVPFLKFLIGKRLIVRFDSILEQFVTLADEKLGIKEGIVYSVKPLSEKEIGKLEKLFSDKLQKEVRLSNRTEPSLLGGIRVFLDGKAYDGSLSAKIENLREKLLNLTQSGGKGL